MPKNTGATMWHRLSPSGPWLARAAIRDTGRALDIPYSEVDTVAKLVPSELGMTLRHALEVSPQLRELREQSPTVRNLLDMAERLEGMPRHSLDPCGGRGDYQGAA